MTGNNSENSSDLDEDSVELRRPAPHHNAEQTFAVRSRASELPTISEIHFLRLSLNENLHKNRSKEKLVSLNRLSGPQMPSSSRSPVDDKTVDELNQFLARRQLKSQHSFIHTSMQNQIKKQEVGEVLLVPKIDDEKEVFGLVPFKRNSFLRNSWNVLRHSFKINHSRSLDEQLKHFPVMGNHRWGDDKAAVSSDSGGEKFSRFSFTSLRGKKGHKRTSSSSSYFSNR